MVKRSKKDVGILYILTSPSNKQYVGITTKRRFEKRMSAHRSTRSSCRYLRNAIQKHGWESFKVEKKEVPVHKLNKLEKETIKRLNTLAPNGYNLTTGGERCVRSELTKKILSKATIKCWKDPEIRAKMCAGKRRLWQNPEYRAKISEANGKQIVVKSFLTNATTTFASMSVASQKLGIGRVSIWSCCRAQQVGFHEFSIRYKDESETLKKKHEDMIKVITSIPCEAQTRNRRHLESFQSAAEAVRWFWKEKKVKINLLYAYNCLSGLSTGIYGRKFILVRKKH